jgi:hypothetical protein
MNTKSECMNASLLMFQKHVIAGVAACFLLLPLAAWGGGVVTNCTEANLRAAMTGGGTVTFACDGTITLAGTITITNDTVLDATGHYLAISGSNTVRVFWVTTNASLSMLHLTIANGRSDKGAGVYNDGGQLLLQNCTLVGNSAIGSAGISYPGHSVFGSNGCGGAVYNFGVLTAVNSAFLSNSVVGGAGAEDLSLIWPMPPGGAGGDGNGGAIGNDGTLSLTGCLLASNSARGGGGGFGRGGNYPAQPPYNCGAPGGTGGGGNGGALYNHGSAFLVNNTFALNLGAGGSGGGGGPGAPPMSQSSSSGNGGNGGSGGSGHSAIYDVNGQCFLTNCTIALNPTMQGAGGTGGPPGPWIYPYPPHLGQPGTNGTDGTAGSGVKTSGAQFFNTLLAGNIPSNCLGTIVDAGHNLSSDGSCSFTNVGSLNNTDPKLGPVANNGGPTLTMALLPGSPAIDAGDTASAPPTDQRGHPRPVGLAADIGAYEFTAVLEISRSLESGLNVLVYGSCNQCCRLLTSTNLVDWQCVATNQIGTNGMVLFQDNCGMGETRRFYRVALP